MVQTMNQSLSIPHLGYCDELHMDKLIHFRNSLKPTADARGLKKLSYMPFIIKAISLALKKYPVINSRINPDLTEISLLASHNIAIAVATPFGLAVPNIKNVQDLSIFEVAEQLGMVIEKANANKLAPADLAGSTFTLSNIGAIGGTYASPVLVPPQVCIGALGKVQKLPRFAPNGEVVPVQIMNISWSADHRVVDGAAIANFSNLFKHYIEEPMSMLLDTK
uniref:2-oxoacid dehydrogenase acyltransferase catalytic domain-containing protein n=1 Tax=Arcella intermedia TaxID=1963864 RepID=A0A6B2LGN3_9EUKA